MVQEALLRLVETWDTFAPQAANEEHLDAMVKMNLRYTMTAKGSIYDLEINHTGQNSTTPMELVYTDDEDDSNLLELLYSLCETNLERQVLSLRSQGHTEQETANRTNRSQQYVSKFLLNLQERYKDAIA